MNSLRDKIILGAVMVLGVMLVIQAGGLTAGSGDEPAPSLLESPFTKQIVGEWVGTGEYDGNAMTLERSWTPDLADHFLRADMRVVMSNGAMFRSLSFWQVSTAGKFRITWMDETGKTQQYEGLWDEEANGLTVQYLDSGPDGSSGWRRLVFRFTGPGSYDELILDESDGDWKQVAEFNFRRSE